MTKPDPILAKVFAAAGNQSKLAAMLGVTRAAVSCWKKVPVRHVREVSKITNIPRQKLRPDVFDENN
jgi:DNA-binding transcriptional regulator YdaS (Cro superfamily)